MHPEQHPGDEHGAGHRAITGAPTIGAKPTAAAAVEQLCALGNDSRLAVEHQGRHVRAGRAGRGGPRA